MTTKEAQSIIQDYESREKHPMGLKLKYVKAKAHMRNQEILKIQGN